MSGSLDWCAVCTKIVRIGGGLVQAVQRSDHPNVPPNVHNGVVGVAQRCQHANVLA